MDKKYCRGCMDNFYNILSKKCLSLKRAKLVPRKKVHVDMAPDWNTKKEKYPDCYRQKDFVFFNDDRKC